MNSYTITIADYELSIRCDLEEKELNEIAAKVDDRIRKHCEHGGSVSRTEAAILCAVEFCSLCSDAKESVDNSDNEVDRLKEELENANAAIAKLEGRFAVQSKKNDEMIASIKRRYDSNAIALEEKYAGRYENMQNRYEATIARLKNKIEKLEQEAAVDSEKPAEKEETPEKPAEEAPATPKPEEKDKSRNRVGDMFELLDFKNI